MGAQEIYLEAGIREGTINVLYIKSAGKSWWSLSAGLFEETEKLSSLEPVCIYPTYTPIFPFNISWKSLVGSHCIWEDDSSYPNIHKQNFKPEKTEAYIWLFLNSRGFCTFTAWEGSRMPRSLVTWPIRMQKSKGVLRGWPLLTTRSPQLYILWEMKSRKLQNFIGTVPTVCRNKTW